jgi:Homeodomain-like domain
VSTWHCRWNASGPDALRGRRPTGPTPRLSDEALAKVEQALQRGAVASGFTGELWTLERIALVIEHMTGVRYHPPTSGQSSRTGSAGVCSVPAAAPPSATRPRIKQTPIDATPAWSFSTSPA